MPSPETGWDEPKKASTSFGSRFSESRSPSARRRISAMLGQFGFLAMKSRARSKPTSFAVSRIASQVTRSRAAGSFMLPASVKA